MKNIKINQDNVKEEWYLVDASGFRIGELASKVAELLLGKTDPFVKDHLNPNKKVVVINSRKIDFTPKRGMTKFYKRYSGFPSGLKFESLESMFERNPNFPIENAVKGMLPKNTRGRKAFTNLKVFVDDNHAHEAQKPKKIDIKNFKI